MFVEIDNEDVGKPVSEYFGVSGDAPRVRYLYYTAPCRYSVFELPRIQLEIWCRFSHIQEMRMGGNFYWKVK